MEMNLDVLAAFPAFSPYSGGHEPHKAALTIASINKVIPSLRALLAALGQRIPEVLDVTAASRSIADVRRSEEMKALFCEYGSDKSTLHNYHHLYAHVLGEPERIRGICEIGLGSPDPDVVSNMGVFGRPGASLRAFRDFCPKALVYGADIDRKVLFTEDRIRTFYADQTDAASLDELARFLPEGLDLVIDDGLHSPDANLNTLSLGLRKVRPGGWVVIEDISPSALPLWECVAVLLRPGYRACLFSAEGGILFAAQKLDASGAGG